MSSEVSLGLWGCCGCFSLHLLIKSRHINHSGRGRGSAYVYGDRAEGAKTVSRQFARDALVLAQERQAKTHNAGYQPIVEFKDGDCALVNPYSLQLVDVQDTGRKLIQGTVTEKINLLVYRLGLLDMYPMYLMFNLPSYPCRQPSLS